MKIDRIRIPPEHDRRRKLSDTVRKNIVDYYNKCHSLRMTAQAFHVARSTVKIIVDPSYRTQLKARKYKRTAPPVSPKMQRLKRLSTRAYKKDLLNRGIISL